MLRKTKRMTDDDADALVWDKLTRTTLDGIGVAPLGTPDLLTDLQTAGRPTRTGDWDIRALHAPPPTTRSCSSTSTAASPRCGCGSTADTDLEAVLDDVLLDLAPVVLDAGDAQVEAAEAFLDVLGDTPAAPGTNLGGATRAWSRSRGWPRRPACSAWSSTPRSPTTGARPTCRSSATRWRSRAAYLRELTDAGFTVDEAAGLMEFRYAATDEQFPQIAKLRAARRLWARVLELSGADASRQRQHVVTSRPMMSKYDPYVNMLRTTVAAFAAGVGGADSVTVLPFDSPLGRPETLGRRIARNTSPLLMWESHVAKVADPAGGSYAVEKLTDDLAVAAWDGARPDRVRRARRVPRAGRRGGGGSGEGGRQAQAADHRAHRVPQPRRDPARARGRRRVRRACAPTAPASRRCATSPPPRRSSWPRSAPSPPTPPAPPSRPTSSPPAASRSSPPGRPLASRSCWRRTTVRRSSASPAPTRRTPSGGARPRPPCARPARTHVIIAGKPVDYADDSCAMGIDALDFLTRTREKLA